MAKLTGKSGIGGRRDQALGPAYRISMWRGIPRVYAVAHRKKKKISPRQQEAMDQFAALAQVAKYITPSEYQNALDLSRGTQYLWRDLIYMTYSGRLFNFQTEDGKYWYSMAARTTTSEMLDVISQEPGTILFRGPTWWEVLEPGLDGQVLHVGPDGFPYWAASGAGGGAISWFDAVTATSNQNACCQGVAMQLSVDLQIQRVGWRWSSPPDGTIVEAAVWYFTDPQLGAKVATTGNVAVTGDNLSRPMFSLLTPVTIPAEQKFAVTVTRKDDTAATPLRYGTEGPINPVLPNRANPRFIYRADLDPSPGDTMTVLATIANFSGVGQIV